LSQVEDKKILEEILNSGLDREILRVLREETVYVVLLVRLRNDERQEEYKQRLSLFEEGE
jgi:hypothetical protein